MRGQPRSAPQSRPDEPAPTTDDPTELLAIYDENATLRGSKPRGAVHRDGDWHRCFSCWVIAHDASGEPGVLLQRRSMGKDTRPGCWDTSAAGHYRLGESMADGGVREMAEELGITVQPDALLPLGTRVGVGRQAGPSGDLIDREFQETYFLHDERPLAAYQPNPQEVMGLLLLPVARGRALLGGAIPRLVLPGVGYDDGGKWVPAQHELTVESFIPTVDSYLPKVLALAERALEGERYLYI